MSGQWIPTPSPMRRYRTSCSAEALRRRGNHSSGTASSRPSARRTRSASVVHETSTARGSILTAEVLIPFPGEEESILVYHAVKFRQLATPKSNIYCETNNGFEPEFRVSLCLLNVNVWRLVSFIAEKEKAIAADSENGGHTYKL
jgi:hypothetical protein